LIDPTSIPSQGTNLGEAVIMGQRALGLTQSQSKAIIILTDGEDHDKSSEAAILEAKKNGIKVFAIGVGTTEGAQIPIGSDVKRDEAGNPVVSAFNQKMLENLAAIGNGSFYQLGMQSDITEEVVSKLKKIESKEFEEFDFSNYNSYFYWFLLIALIFIFIEFILPSVDFKTFFKKTSFVILVAISFSKVESQTKDELAKKRKAQTFIRKGNVAYQNGRFQDAELNYRKSLAENSKNTTAKYNLANTLYEQKKYKESADLLETAKKEFQDKPSRARSLHNAGNAHYKGGDLEKAIKSYEDALKLNPSDAETKFNLAMAKKEKKNQGGGGQNNQKNQKKEGDKKENGQKQEDERQDGNEPKSETPKPGQMTKDEAQKLLDALKNQEQNTQKKVDQQRQKPEQKKHEKDW
ncbi:MAG: vWA domain-containing protein, partial [Chitinophagales bacterium]